MCTVWQSGVSPPVHSTTDSTPDSWIQFVTSLQLPAKTGLSRTKQATYIPSLLTSGQQCTLISYCVADMKVKRSLSMPQPVQGATYSPPSQTRPPVGSEVGRRWPSTPALALQVSPSYSQTGTIVIQHRIAIRVYYMERYNYVLVVILFISNLWNYANVHINKTLCQSSYWLL